MKNVNRIIILISIFVIFLLLKNGVLGKRGGGGGGSRSSSSRSSSSRFWSSRYSSRSGSSRYSFSSSHYKDTRAYSDGQVTLRNIAKKIVPLGVAFHLAKTHMNHPKVDYYHHNHYRRGYYYDYNYRSGFESINGSLCSNNQTYDGLIYGHFICPIEGFMYYDIYCCGKDGDQYCCSDFDGPFEWYIYVLAIIITMMPMLCCGGLILLIINCCKK